MTLVRSFAGMDTQDKARGSRTTHNWLEKPGQFPNLHRCGHERERSPDHRQDVLAL
jgi:hypothetical protein